jgi:hypothetical protein
MWVFWEILKMVRKASFVEYVLDGDVKVTAWFSLGLKKGTSCLSVSFDMKNIPA